MTDKHMNLDLCDMQRQAALNVIAYLLRVHENRDAPTAEIIANQLLTRAMEDLVIERLEPLLRKAGRP